MNSISLYWRDSSILSLFSMADFFYTSTISVFMHSSRIRVICVYICSAEDLICCSLPWMISIWSMISTFLASSASSFFST